MDLYREGDIPDKGLEVLRVVLRSIYSKFTRLGLNAIRAYVSRTHLERIVSLEIKGLRIYMIRILGSS